MQKRKNLTMGNFLLSHERNGFRTTMRKSMNFVSIRQLDVSKHCLYLTICITTIKLLLIALKQQILFACTTTLFCFIMYKHAAKFPLALYTACESCVYTPRASGAVARCGCALLMLAGGQKLSAHYLA